jgi:hypothetical protein
MNPPAYTSCFKGLQKTPYAPWMTSPRADRRPAQGIARRRRNHAPRTAHIVRSRSDYERATYVAFCAPPSSRSLVRISLWP